MSAGKTSGRPRARPLSVLGIMSGTSIDGVDYALCSIDHTRVQLKRYWQTKFSGLLRERLSCAARGLQTSHETAQLHHDLGRWYASEARRGLVRCTVDLVGMHGQTIFHNPGRSSATFQLGEPAYLVEALRVPVVSNFRAADLAAGGQGAPLATLFHCVVFGKMGEHVCVNNLGGISNVTSIDWRTGSKAVTMAFDTGPANLMIDLAVQHFTDGLRRFDRNGVWASQGKASELLLDRWLDHPFFRKKPPKSTGRELFGEPSFSAFLTQARKARLSEFDIVATLTELTARSLALNYARHLASAPGRVILTGGGASNPVLAECIRNRLSKINANVRVQTCDQLGWPVQSVEPAAFALLAYYRLCGIPANLPSTTGAARRALLGQISEP